MGAAKAAALPLSYEQHSEKFCQTGEAFSPAVLDKIFLCQQFFRVAPVGTNVAFQL